jgi:hypothetical protein
MINESQKFTGMLPATPHAGKADAPSTQAPDASWRGLYLAGGICAMLYVLLSLIIPAVMVLVTRYDFSMDGAVFLEAVAAHPTWWLVLQTLVIGTSILAIVVFAALFLSLKHLNKSLAALGSMIAIVIEILFLAYYPVLLGIVYLSEQYAQADAALRDVYVSAAEALIAQNNAFNPLYEPLLATSILLVSLVMLKGVYYRGIAYLGILTAPVAFVCIALWPVIGVAYFWWWTLFVVWFLAIGWTLIRLGQANGQCASTAIPFSGNGL